MSENERECDFCQFTVDLDEEELTPIFVGAPPEPEPIRLEETVKKMKGRTGYSTQVLRFDGVNIAAYRALDNALQSSPEIEIDLYDQVERMESIDHTKTVGAKYESVVDDSMARAKMTIRPKPSQTEPTVEVCEMCANMFHERFK